MTAGPAEAVQTPPYAPWKTFVGFLESLKNTAIPSQIDASVMTKMSGTAKSQVRGALRFFDLIDDTGTVTQSLHDLASSVGTDTWVHEWKAVFLGHYQQIIGDLDTDRATLKQLVDRFRDNGGVSGSVLRKSLRFYLDGLTATGCTFSPHFKARGLSVVSGDRPAKAKTNGKPTNGTKSDTEVPRRDEGGRADARQSSPDDFMIQLPSRGTLAVPVPADLSLAEWNYIDSQVRAYMALRGLK
ncbi:MAG TPA: hypothetical protein VGQ44_02675 [Gemmatimonadaceae bacterium]|jgi:hypothetical protein|nr:hypothetical protein [Gemmatimonadaceae bacterium]